MKITAVGIGTRGDVQPIAELCKELQRRGHECRLATLEGFHELADGLGVPYFHLDGSADNLMRYLVLDNRGDLDFFRGAMKLCRETPRLMDQLDEAVAGADLVIYNFLGGFAYHPCELRGIPCVRVFYSPFDATTKYSLYTPEHDSQKVFDSYRMEEPGMNLLTILNANRWRKAHGLAKWTMRSDYRYQGDVPVQTFYPVSPRLMEPDPAWGDHIHVCGWWFHPEEDERDYVPDEGLAAFLAQGDAPIFAGFGKMAAKEYEQLQRMTLAAFEELGVRAVMQAPLLSDEERAAASGRILFVQGTVPYGWLFRHVKAVVHHGGNSTNGLGLRAGRPTLVAALALDQHYYGRTVHELGVGPEPLYVCKKMCSQAQVTSAIAELADGRYQDAAAELGQRLLKEDGCATAAQIIERRFG